MPRMRAFSFPNGDDNAIDLASDKCASYSGTLELGVRCQTI